MNKITDTELIEFINDNILRNKKIVITKTTLLFKDKTLDSMNILDIIGFIENKIGRKIKDEELIMSNFKNIKSIAEFFSNG